MARITVWDSARTNEIAREPMRVGESATSPTPPKGVSGDGSTSTNAGAWGRMEGAQGALTQPE